jgi:hypothetical protein
MLDLENQRHLEERRLRRVSKDGRAHCLLPSFETALRASSG